MIRTLASAALLLALSGCNNEGASTKGLVTEWPATGTEQDVISQVFAGRSNLEIMQSATAIKACRLIAPASHDYIELSAYEEGPWVQVPSASADRLRTIFADPPSYYFDAAKSCLPIFGVRLRFESDEGTIDVSICFQCDILAVSRDGEDVGGGNFDPARAQLVVLCKDLFPDDPEIQRLELTP